MTSKKLFYILLGFVAILIVIASALTYQGLSMLQKKGNKLTELKTQQAALRIRQADLETAKHDVKKYEELEKISKAIVPQEKDQARTVREIVVIAQESGIPLESIQFPSSELGAPKGKNSKSKINPSTTQLTPVPGANGLYAMEISVKSDSKAPVRYNQLLNFLERLEQNRRTAHVTNIAIDPYKDNRNLITFTITLNVYIKP